MGSDAGSELGYGSCHCAQATSCRKTGEKHQDSQGRSLPVVLAPLTREFNMMLYSLGLAFQVPIWYRGLST